MNENENDNIKLEYAVKIYTDRSLETVLFANRCEFFRDEHGKQWVKFIAHNGYDKGKEHMLRTELLTIIRDDRVSV